MFFLNSKAHIPPKNGFALGARRKWNLHKKHEMYMLDAKMLRWHPTQPIFHWLALGFCVGGNANFSIFRYQHNAKYTNMLVYFALGNANFWCRVHCPTPTPDARYFAFWWNIGLRVNMWHLNYQWHPFRDCKHLKCGYLWEKDNFCKHLEEQHCLYTTKRNNES